MRKKVNIVNDGIGENIRKMRKKRGLSQTQLANKLGQLQPSDLNAVSEYVDFMLNKNKAR